MLEVLLLTYKNQFGTEFPLVQFEGMREIDLINLLYTCLQDNKPYHEGMRVDERVNGAPGQK